MLLRRRMSRLARSTVKFAGSMPCGWPARAGISPVRTFNRPIVKPARLPGEAAADPERRHQPAIEADAAAEEQIRRHAAPGGQSGARAAGEREDAEILEEEIALLGKEQIEARQVDLLFVHFHLREVGVDRQVGGQVLRHAVLQVGADAGGPVVGEAGRHRRVGRDAGQAVRLQLDVAAAGRHLEADQRGRGRHLEDAAEGRERPRDLREVRPFVLPAHDAPQVDAPGLIASGLVAQRLERDRHLDGPSAVEAAGLDVPHRVPVDVRRPFVGDLAVAKAADRVRA